MSVRPKSQAHFSHGLDSPVRNGIFPQESAFNADSLTVFVQPPCAITCIYSCANVKDRKQWQPYYCLDMLNIMHTLVGMGNPAFAAALFR